MNERHILVIGNGFDLYHGFRTTYKDFTDTVTAAQQIPAADRTEAEKALAALGYTNGFVRYFQAFRAAEGTWKEFEEQLEAILQVFLDFMAKIRELKKDADFDILRFSLLMQDFTYFELKMFQRFFKIFEQIYDDSTGGLFHIRPEFITQNKQLDEKKIIQELRTELDEFTSALGCHLTEETKTACSIRFPKFEEIQPDYVVNFNFTDTYKLYDIPEDCVFYVKGRASGEHPNMVLGVPDESEDHLEFIYFKNYFQSIMKFTGTLDMANIKPSTDETTVAHIFGHSLSQGDAGILKTIFSTADQTVIYYTDQDDYAMKVIQLIRMLGKDAVMQGMQTREFVFCSIS